MKKKSKNLPQLVFSLKNKNNSNSLRNSNDKKLEYKIKNNSSDSSSTKDYSSLEKYFSDENANLSQNRIKFSNTNNSNKILDKTSINYLKFHE